MQLSRRAPSVLGAALAVCLGAASARAQGRADSRGDSSPAAPIHAGNASAAAAISPSGAVLGPDAIRRLKSGDAAQIKLGLDDVRVAGRAGASAVPAIAQLLREGLSPTLVQAALETLGDTESEAATEIVAWYARHRNLALRRTAVDALAKTGGPGAARALRAAL
jgi:HEAT repeat protein